MWGRNQLRCDRRNQLRPHIWFIHLVYPQGVFRTMEIEAFATLVIPFIVVAYLGVAIFVHPTRAVLAASLIGGLVMGIINALFDLLAYYTHIWHYTLNGLILHLPLPFYLTPILIYGSLGYLLIARFWRGRGHWFALLLLIGIPLFRTATDFIGGYTQGSYT